MSLPTRSDVHVDAVLTNMAIAYIQNAMHFIAQRVFPVVNVEKQSGKYFTLDKNDWRRDEARRRADGDRSAGGGFRQSTDNYSCEVDAFHKKVGPQATANQDEPLDLITTSTNWVTRILLLRQEIQWVADYFTTSVWDDDVTPSSLWSDFSASDPVVDVDLGKETILLATGFLPNKFTMGYQVFRQLRRHPVIRDQFKYTSAESITPAMMAGVFDVEEVLISKVSYNTAQEGATASNSFAAGKNALLSYAPATPGLLEPSAGYTFAWDEISEGLGEQIAVRQWFESGTRSDYVEAEAAWDNKVTGSDLGYFFSGAVA